MRAAPGFIALAGVLGAAACHPATTPATAGPSRASQVTLAVLPAESATFPRVARAITESLANARVSGVDQTQLSKVSLEIVQLSIECVEQTVDCYEQVGHSLAANRLLFAQLAPDGRRHVKVTVTLFDVDARAPRRAEKVFTSEEAATRGVAELVAEATR